MDARALVCNSHGRVKKKCISLAEPDDTDVVVDTSYSGVSIGTELNLIRGDVIWKPYPLCTGYQATGTVTHVGCNVTNLSPDDSVYYRKNQFKNTADNDAVSAVHGTHCSKAVVDTETQPIGPLPKGADPKVASTFVMPAIGLNAVEMVGLNGSETVVVQGAGLVGLGVIAWASLRAETVIVIEPIDSRRETAVQLGADHAINSENKDIKSEIESIQTAGADVVFEATGVKKLIDSAIALCRPKGSFVFLSDYGETDISFAFRPAHTNQLTAYFPCGDGGTECRYEAVTKIAEGTLNWDKALTDTVAPAKAEAFYKRLSTGEANDVLGAAFNWR